MIKIIRVILACVINQFSFLVFKPQ